jgi:hypothetical protein
MVMSKLFRAALLSAIVALSLLPMTFSVPRVSAGAVQAAASKTKKKSKSKPKKTKKILKGHHGKHKGKPA